MKVLKKVLRIIRSIYLLPFAPFSLMLALYIFIQIRKNTSPVEMEFYYESGESMVTPEIKQWGDALVKKLRPVMYLFSTLTWLTIFKEEILKLIL